jgi:hypothetical protein
MGMTHDQVFAHGIGRIRRRHRRHLAFYAGFGGTVAGAALVGGVAVAPDGWTRHDTLVGLVATAVFGLGVLAVDRFHLRRIRTVATAPILWFQTRDGEFFCLGSSHSLFTGRLNAVTVANDNIYRLERLDAEHALAMHWQQLSFASSRSTHDHCDVVRLPEDASLDECYARLRAVFPHARP